MSKISRYSIAIFLSIFIEQLLINNHTIFMQVEAALLWWRHKNKYIKCYRAREGGGGRRGRGGERHYILVHIPVYMNTVLPKWYKKISSYLSLDCTYRKGLLHGMSYTSERNHA